jgi:amidohydrolase
MKIYPRLADLHGEMTKWRQDLHAHPETAFEEHRTSAFIVEKLKSFGIEVDVGMAGTGVVGTIKGKREGDQAIGLRADIDALDIHELTNRPYASKNPGKMHACGHDGHTTMLLGAAQYLAETRNFAGTAYVIFQPAEENEGGAKVMVEEGLFDKYPMQAVYGMHNWPGYKVGEVAASVGPIMAAFDRFDLIITGKGAHAAMPHQGIDPIVIGAQIVSALQTISSRSVDPIESVVVSVTQFQGGDTYNVIPNEVVLRGTVRSFNPEVQKLAEANIEKIAKGIAAAHGASAELRYQYGYPATVNSEIETGIAADIARKVVGEENVRLNVPPVMGAEDFAFMLEKKPGSYIWFGVGEDVANLHSPHYDFNDEALPAGASYWARLVEDTLA